MYKFAIALVLFTCFAMLYLVYFMFTRPENETDMYQINIIYKTGYIEGQNSVLKNQLYGMDKDSLFIIDSIRNENIYKPKN